MEKRVWGIDLIKVLALIFVVSIHGITLSNLVAQTFTTAFWIPTLLMRTIVLSCVPLFIIVTGYLQKDKELNKRYFASLIPVLFSYLIISALSEISKVAAGETTHILKAILHIFDFTANGYAWYVEMYIGLFLIIPFLNHFYKSLGTDRNRLTAIVVIIGITMLPGAFSSIGLTNFRLAVLPTYWEAMYPIAYYFIGVLIADFKPKIKKTFNVIALIAWVVLMTICCFILSYFSGQYAWWFANGFGCIYNAVTAVLIFLLFYDIDIKAYKVKSFVTAISTITLEAYLFSYITDKILYKFLTLPMPVMTAMTLVCAVILAVVLKKATNGINSLLYDKYFEIIDRPKKELT